MIKSLARLFRLRLAFANGSAAMGGYLLFPVAADMLPLAAAFFGVFFLAAGSSALNQVAERDLDLLMARTAHRPVPRGVFTPPVATLLGLGAVTSGGAILAAVGGAKPLVFGIAAVLWYLGIYTPLKRRTPFALPLGAVCGAVPPVIGWCLAGGGARDYRIILLAGLLYLWQVPHFLLLQGLWRDDYGRAGLPVFGQGLTAGPALPSSVLLWSAALVAAAALLPALGVVEARAPLRYGLLLLPLLGLASLRSEKARLSCFNLFPLLLTLILFLGK